MEATDESEANRHKAHKIRVLGGLKEPGPEPFYNYIQCM